MPSGSVMPSGSDATGAAGAMPTTQSGLSRAGGGTVSTALVTLLKKDAGSYTWVAATTSANSAAPIQLATGKAVMAIGGFTGSDPSSTLAQFKQLVAAGKIHYYVTGGGGGPGGGSNEISSWVTSTYTAVTVGGTTVYDLTQAA